MSTTIEQLELEVQSNQMCIRDRYIDSDRAKFIVIPALDENDESNFDYAYGVGFLSLIHIQMCIRDRYDATYDEEFGKIEVKLVNAAGMTHTERFSSKDKNEELNEKALNAFSYFAKTAMGDFTLEDIDPEELIDHFICAEVVHTKLPSNKDPNKTVTFANLGDKSPACLLYTSRCVYETGSE